MNDSQGAGELRLSRLLWALGRPADLSSFIPRSSGCAFHAYEMLFSSRPFAKQRAALPLTQAAKSAERCLLFLLFT